MEIIKRRELFKRVAKTIPIIVITAISISPIKVLSANGCNHACMQHCSDGCTKGCGASCFGACSGSTQAKNTSKQDNQTDSCKCKYPKEKNDTTIKKK